MYDSRVADAMEQRTSNSLLAFYTTMSQQGIDEAPLMYTNEESEKDTYTLQKVLEDQIKENSEMKLFQNLHDQYIDDRTGLLNHNAVLAATKCLNASQNAERLINFLFSDGREGITFSEFFRLAKTLTDDDLGVLMHSRSNRNDKGFLQVKVRHTIVNNSLLVFNRVDTMLLIFVFVKRHQRSDFSGKSLEKPI